MRLASPVCGRVEMVELTGYWGLSPRQGSTVLESRWTMRKERHRSNGVASEEAPLRHSPRVGYLSSCSPTQDIVRVTVKRR